MLTIDKNINTNKFSNSEIQSTTKKHSINTITLLPSSIEKHHLNNPESIFIDDMTEEESMNANKYYGMKYNIREYSGNKKSVNTTRGKENHMSIMWSADKKMDINNNYQRQSNNKNKKQFTRSEHKPSYSQAKTVYDVEHRQSCEESTEITTSFDIKNNNNTNKSLIQSLLTKSNKKSQQQQQQQKKCEYHHYHNRYSPLLFQIEMKNEFTFKPEISSEQSLVKLIKSKEYVYNEKEKEEKQENKLSKEERFERLVDNLRKKHVERLEYKLQIEKNIIDTMCNFQPNISKAENNNKEKIQQLYKEENIGNIDKNTTTVHEKLFLQSIEKRQKLNYQERLKNEQQEQTLKDLLIKQKARLQKSKEKLLQVMKDNHHANCNLNNNMSEENKEQQMANHESSREQHYNPEEYQQKLTSKKLSQVKSQQLVKRLVDDYLESKTKKEHVIEERVQKELQLACPFTPSLEATDLHRDKLSTTNKKHINYELNEYKNECTFMPKINSMSKVIVENNHKGWEYNNRSGYGYVDVGERLCYGDQNLEKLKRLGKIKAEMDYECTFAPVINSISKELVYENIEEGSKHPPVHQCPLPESHFEQENQLTFHPEINPKSKCMTEREKLEFLEKNNKKSKEKLNKISNQLQYKEVEECTFYPKTVSTTEEWKKWKDSNLKTNKMTLKSSEKEQKITYNKIEETFIEKTENSTIVRGLESYMRNCENIKRKKIDHEERLNKIFNFEQRYDERVERERKKE